MRQPWLQLAQNGLAWLVCQGIGIDFITGLPLTLEGNDMILTFVLADPGCWVFCSTLTAMGKSQKRYNEIKHPQHSLFPGSECVEVEVC